MENKITEMRVLKFVIIAVVIIAVLWSLKVILSDKPKKSIGLSSIREKNKESLTEQMRQFTITGFTDSGNKAWELNANTADILADIVNLSTIKGTSFGDDVKVELTSVKGVFNRSSSDILLKEDVIIKSDEGTVLLTDSLNWSAKEEIVTTDDFVFINRKDMDVSGKGAWAKPNLKIANILKEVTLVVKDPPAVITCDGPLEMDYYKNVAYFNNKVHVVDKETVIDADKATAYFDPKKRSLVKVLCVGNVEITRGEDKTFADSLTYLPEEGRVVLKGRPKIIIDSSGDLLNEVKDSSEKEPS